MEDYPDWVFELAGRGEAENARDHQTASLQHGCDGTEKASIKPNER